MIGRRRLSPFFAASLSAIAAAAAAFAPASGEGLLGTSVFGLIPAAPVELLEEEGDGDGFLDPGERWSFRPTLANLAASGAGSPASASLRAEFGSAPIVLHDPSVSFGAIAGGATQAANERIRFTIAANAPCSGAVEIEMYDLATSAGAHYDGGQAFYREIGEVQATNLMSQDFAGGLAPFQVVDGGTGDGPAATWTTANPGNHHILDPPFAIVDADQHAGGGDTMDEALESPNYAIGSFSEIHIEFDHLFRHWEDPPEEIGDVEWKSLSTFGQWERIARFTGRDYAGHISIDLTNYQPDLYVGVRFHYFDAGWEFYWAIDNVKIRAITSRSCKGASALLFADGFESGDTTAWAEFEP